MKKTLQLIGICCLLFATLSWSRKPSKKKIKHTGVYTRLYNVSSYSDTLACELVLSADTFVLIYQIQYENDTDYKIPLIKGTWNALNDTLLELKHGNTTIQAPFEYSNNHRWILLNGVKLRDN